MMRKLTQIVIPAVMAATLFGAAGPASAQHYDNHGYAGHHATPGRAEAIRNQLDQLQRRIERNDNRDRISEREAAGLRRDIRSVREQFRRFNRDGLSNREFHVLQNRIDNIRGRLHVERNDRDGRRW